MDQVSPELVAQYVAQQQDPDRLLGADGVAALLDCSARYVTEHYVAAPGFPKARRLTLSGGRRSQPKWRRGDILEWIAAHEGGKTKRGGRPRN